MNFWKFNGQSLEYTVGEMCLSKGILNQPGSQHAVFHKNKENIGKFGLNLVSQDIDPKVNAKSEALKRLHAKQMKSTDIENIFVTFLCIGFINDTLITTGDDGYIYIWEQARIVRRIFAHEGAIYSLDCN